MKKIKINMALVLLVGTLSFFSCGKKHCHKPKLPKPLHGCHHHPDSIPEKEGE